MNIDDILGLNLPSDDDIKKETASAKKSATLKAYGENHASKRKEVRESISNSHKGLKASEETRKKLSEAHIGQAPWNVGKVGVQKCSQEKKLKQSQMYKGSNNPAFKGWMVGTHKITGEEVWHDGRISLQNAKPKPMDIRNVNAAIRGKIPSAYGYVWRREQEYKK